MIKYLNAKQMLAFLFTLIYGMGYAGQEKPQEIKAPISSVKVCLNAALISHTQKIKLKTGMNKLAFVGLAMNIDKRNISLRNIGKSELISLQLVKLSDTTDISSLQPDLLYMIRSAKDSIITIEKNIEKLSFELEGLKLEQQMLLKNDDIIPNSKPISLSELKLTTEYYRERYASVSMEILSKQRSLTQLKKNKVKALKSAFDVESSEENNMNISIIMADINNPESEYSADMELSYLTSGSGWIPVYEIFSTGNKTLKINYRAKILNNTGIDWDNLNITLSTADPSQYYAAPDLEPFIVSQSDGYKYRRNYSEDDNDEQTKQPSVKQHLKPKGTIEEEEIFTPDREITFNIAKRYSFRTGLTPSLVDVTGYDLTPDFLYRCAPKKEEQVYCIARIKDWEKLNLIDGEANVYNNGTFLGKSYIRPSDFEDYMELPLGVVNTIFVKHKQVSELSSKKVFSGGINAAFTYEIKIKNNSSEKVNVEVIDQVPVSERSNVKVENIEIAEAGEQDPLTGKIVWKLNLDPASEKSLSLKYSVSYPKSFRYSSFYKKRQVRAKF